VHLTYILQSKSEGCIAATHSLLYLRSGELMGEADGCKDPGVHESDFAFLFCFPCCTNAGVPKTLL
jgi:hypothetical protein